MGANLTVADLERVRQALSVLSDDPVAAPVRTATPDDDDDVPLALPGPPAIAPGGETDEPDTSPLPVVLGGGTPAPIPEPVTFAGGTPIPRPGPVEAPRGPFEPAQPRQAEPAQPEQAEDLPPSAAEKLNQIKDLLVTAEALGEENLDKHFEQVSRRQRQLIREFFDRAMPERDAQL